MLYALSISVAFVVGILPCVIGYGLAHTFKWLSRLLAMISATFQLYPLVKMFALSKTAEYAFFQSAIGSWILFFVTLGIAILGGLFCVGLVFAAAPLIGFGVCGYAIFLICTMINSNTEATTFATVYASAKIGAIAGGIAGLWFGSALTEAEMEGREDEGVF